MDRWPEVHEGMDVLDLNGQKIDKVGEIVGRYFNVDAGFLGAKEYYIPFDTIIEVVENAVYVNVTKDRLDGMGWERYPEEPASEPPSYARGVSLREQGIELGTHRSFDVPVTREEVFVERMLGGDPVRREWVGDVDVGKRVVTETQPVSETVRREEVAPEPAPVLSRPSDAQAWPSS